MKLNFSKFLRDRSSKATVPAAKFSGQRYGIGSSSFYDEDEEGDVKMVRPSKRDSMEDDSNFDDDHLYSDSELDYSDEMDDDFDESNDGEEDDEPQMSAETARVLSDLIHNISSCDSEMCANIKDWIETSDHFSNSDRDYLMQMFDDVSSDVDDMDIEAEYDDEYDEDRDFDDNDDQDDSEIETNDDVSLDDKLTSLKNRYKDEEEEMRFSSFAKKKF